LKAHEIPPDCTPHGGGTQSKKHKRQLKGGGGGESNCSLPCGSGGGRKSERGPEVPKEVNRRVGETGKAFKPFSLKGRNVIIR